MRTRAKVVTGCVALLALVAVYFTLDPSTMRFPRCPFLVLTGWRCPGCGSQRAVHALLHGDVAAAWRFNAALVAALPLIALLLFAEMTRRRFPDFYRRVNSTPVIIGCAVAFILWWVSRNLFGWYV
ncbi:MAG: DUF2752 domain-containing protein [Muribaculaceae bacterium]